MFVVKYGMVWGAEERRGEQKQQAGEQVVWMLKRDRIRAIVDRRKEKGSGDNKWEMVMFRFKEEAIRSHYNLCGANKTMEQQNEKWVNKHKDVSSKEE